MSKLPDGAKLKVVKPGHSPIEVLIFIDYALGFDDCVPIIPESYEKYKQLEMVDLVLVDVKTNSIKIKLVTTNKIIELKIGESILINSQKIGAVEITLLGVRKNPVPT